MKLLLDECTPNRLRLDFPGHDDLKMLAAKALHALRTIKAGDVVRIQRE
jgi:hypothetical protein